MPGLLTEVLENEVKKRMNNEIKLRIESEAKEMAKANLAQLVTEAWPRFVKESVEPIVQRIIAELGTSLPRFLAEEMTVVCDKCGNRWQHMLDPERIGELITRGETKVTCPDRSCKDVWWRHEIPLWLSDWIAAHLGVNQQPGPT